MVVDAQKSKIKGTKAFSFAKKKIQLLFDVATARIQMIFDVVNDGLHETCNGPFY